MDVTAVWHALSMHAPDGPRFAYPVVLDLHGVDVLVVGAGPVAARKVAGLAAAGAAVTVVAPQMSADMEAEVAAGRVATLHRRPYEPDDVARARLAVTATGEPAVDAAVAADATAAGVWVNAADQRDDCTFILPAIARAGRVTVAVSTDGASPALARRLRDRAGELLGDDVAALADELAAARAAVRAAGGSTEDVDWSSQIDRVVPPA